MRPVLQFWPLFTGAGCEAWYYRSISRQGGMAVPGVIAADLVVVQAGGRLRVSRRQDCAASSLATCGASSAGTTGGTAAVTPICRMSTVAAPTWM